MGSEMCIRDRNVSEGADFIEINGERKHIMGYMQDFLFDPERARAPITKLSGGERNRLLLAKLFTDPPMYWYSTNPPTILM